MWLLSQSLNNITYRRKNKQLLQVDFPMEKVIIDITQKICNRKLPVYFK